MGNSSETEKFCSKCGNSLIPLEVPYVSHECGECGKTVHALPRESADGSGITVQNERFTIPAGFLSLSLDPSANTKLFRPGIRFYLKQIFLARRPQDIQAMSNFAENLAEQADEILRNSESIKGFDLENPEQSEAIINQVLEKGRDSREAFALQMGSFASSMEKALEEGDANSAAYAAYMAATLRGLTVVTESVFENTLWRGYLSNHVVYEAAASASQTPSEAEAIKKLEPLFRKLDEAILFAWVESELPIGPRIGVTKVPEGILTGLAKWHLAAYERERAEKRESANEKRAAWELRLKWMTFGLGLATTLFTVLIRMNVL